MTQSPTKELIFFIKSEQMKQMLNSSDLKGVFNFFLENKRTYRMTNSMCN